MSKEVKSRKDSTKHVDENFTKTIFSFILNLDKSNNSSSKSWWHGATLPTRNECNIAEEKLLNQFIDLKQNTL